MQIIEQGAGDSGAAFIGALKNCGGRYADMFRDELAGDGKLTVDQIGRYELLLGGDRPGDPKFRAVFADDEYGQTLVQSVTHADGRHITPEDFPKPKRR